MKKHIVKGEVCLNCDTALDGENFCPNCGQINNTAKPTLGQLLLDALANLFAFDTKFYLSIWPLITKPGKLSLSVVAGKRMQFLPPIRLFLLVTIIMLGLSSLSDRFTRSWDDVDHLRKEDESIFVTNSDSTAGENDLQLTFDEGEYGTELKRIYEFVAANEDLSVDEGLAQLGLEERVVYRFFYSSFLKLVVMDSKEFVNYIKSNLLLIFLAFIPVLALILKALYFYKKNYFYVDHFIFSLHSQTAFFVYIIFYMILFWLINYWALLLIIVGFPIYLFIALKNFYKQGVLLTLLNFLVVNISFVAVSGFFLLLVSLVSFLLI